MHVPHIMKVNGDSMYPCIYTNDTLYVRKAREYQRGDILVYRYEGMLLVHRLLAFEDETFCCKGDNSFRVEHVVRDDVIGKVIMLKRDSSFIHIAEVSECFICASYTIGQLFESFNGDVKQVKNTQEYQAYKALYLDRCSDVRLRSDGLIAHVHGQF